MLLSEGKRQAEAWSTLAQQQLQQLAGQAEGFGALASQLRSRAASEQEQCRRQAAAKAELAELGDRRLEAQGRLQDLSKWVGGKGGGRT